MNRILLITILGLISTTLASKDKNKCEDNAVFKRCPNPCPKTCSGDILRDNDAECLKKCIAGCECKDDYILNDNGECISIDDCKQTCPTHSHYNSESCSNSCKHLFDGEPCEPTKENCECDEGYFLDGEGNCVSIFECQPEEVICPVNQTFYTCASSCPVSCANMFIPSICNMMCNVKCDCLPGHVFNNEGVCISAIDCPLDEIKCPSNKVYNPCGNHQRTCENLYEPFSCSSDCIPGCYCPEGQAYNSELDLCVPTYDCPNSLENKACQNVDLNMQYNHCHIGEARTCECPEVSTEGSCNSGCYCKAGMVLNRHNKCVLLEECNMKKHY